MNWHLFFIVQAIVFFTGVHAVFLARIKIMAEMSLSPIDVASHPIAKASQLMTGLANINLLIFFIVAIFKLGWLVAIITVFGGALASYLMTFLMRGGNMYDILLTSHHKISWLALPILSISLWLILLAD